MPDVQEVFRMSTQKVRPDQGFTQRQEFRQRRRMRKRKLGAYAVVAAMLAVGAFAVVSTQRGESDVPVPATTPSPSSVPGSTVTTNWYLDIATGERSPVTVALPAAQNLAVSPNGEAIAYSVCCDVDDGIYVAGLDGSAPTLITPAELDGYAPTWIDDERILFQGRPEGTRRLGDLYVANLPTGEMTMVTNLPDERHPAWFLVTDVSPDGTTAIFHLPRGRGDVTYDLWTAPLTGGEPSLLRKNAGFAQYAPDSSIVFLDHPVPFSGDAIWIMNGDGSGGRPLVERRDVASPRVSPDGTKVSYMHDGEVELVDIESGDVTTTGQSSDEASWFDNDKLIV